MLARPPSTTRNVPPSLPVDAPPAAAKSSATTTVTTMPVCRVAVMETPPTRVKCNARCMEPQEPSAAFLDLLACRSTSPSPTSRRSSRPPMRSKRSRRAFADGRGRGRDRAAAPASAARGRARGHGRFGQRARARRREALRGDAERRDLRRLPVRRGVLGARRGDRGRPARAASDRCGERGRCASSREERRKHTGSDRLWPSGRDPGCVHSRGGPGDRARGGVLQDAREAR